MLVLGSPVAPSACCPLLATLTAAVFVRVFFLLDFFLGFTFFHSPARCKVVAAVTTTACIASASCGVLPVAWLVVVGLSGVWVSGGLLTPASVAAVVV